MKTINQKLNDCRRIGKDLRKLANIKGNDDEYYKKEELIQMRLRDILNSDEIANLTKRNLLELILLCSSYRPSALHSILISFAIDKSVMELTGRKE